MTTPVLACRGGTEAAVFGVGYRVKPPARRDGKMMDGGKTSTGGRVMEERAEDGDRHGERKPYQVV